MKEPKVTETPQTVVELVEAKLREDSGGGMLYVQFPKWAGEIFQSTLVAATRNAVSPAYIAIYALAKWLEGNGYVTYQPPKPKALTLPEDVERDLYAAMNWAITGADATTKKDKDQAFAELLPILRGVLNGKEGQQND